MDSNYDECLDQNPFYKAIRENRGDLIRRATEENWIICIPRMGTMESSVISTEDILEHILMPSIDLPVTHFTTLANRSILVQDKYIVINNEEPVRVLFDETFYIDKSLKYKLWCIERPLHKCLPMNYKKYNAIKNIHDCIKLLWTKDHSILDKINQLIDTFLNDLFQFASLEEMKQRYSNLYVSCSDVLSKELHLSDNLNLALESYIQQCIYCMLSKTLCNYVAQSESNFNKILRNLVDVHLKDLDITQEFFECILDVKRKLCGFTKTFTVIEKVQSLRHIIDALSVQKESVVTTDVLLKIFVFLIIKSKANNWITNLYYVTHFRLSSLNLSNEHSFIITTLEAAIEHIKNGGVCIKPNVGANNFFTCIQAGDLTTVKKFLDAKKKETTVMPLCHPLCACEKCKSVLPVSINSCNEKGYNALHVACLYGHPLVVEYLLSKGIDPDAVDCDNATPLHFACSKGNQNAVLLLLHVNASVILKDDEGNTPLHLAANNGHESCIKALVYFMEQQGCFINVNCKNNMEDTPLHLAVKWGYMGITNILLQYGADVNLKNKRNQTAFDIAHNDYIKNLLLTSKYFHGQTIKASSTVSDIDKNISKDLEHLKKIDLILNAIENNDIPLMCFHLGIPTPQVTKVLNTKQTCHPLCMCEHCQEQFESCSASISTSTETFNINSSNCDGYSPLHIAAKYGRLEILRLLLDAGAFVNIRTTERCTPLHIACKYQRIQIVRELLKCGGCEIDVQDDNGNTPLHYACLGNNNKIVELLLSHDSDCNIKNVDGNMPLQVAKSRMFSNIIKLLENKIESSTLSDNIDDLFSS